MQSLRESRQRPLRIGLIGLGAGTMLSYAQEGDRWDVYELDPDVVRLADEYFTYIKDARSAGATVEIHVGDGRLSLERQAPRAFDALFIDAFSGDAIPTHLLTAECCEIYEQHMDSAGVVAFHTSNRYIDLLPVVKGLAERRDWNCRLVDYTPPGERHFLFSVSSEWILTTRDPEAFQSKLWSGRATSKLTDKRGVVWTDQFSNLLGVLK